MAPVIYGISVGDVYLAYSLSGGLTPATVTFLIPRDIIIARTWINNGTS